MILGSKGNFDALVATQHNICAILFSGLSRPLGTMETNFYTMGLSFSVVTFALKAKVQPGKKITSVMIQRALQIWQKENPSLQVKVEKRGTEFWFVPLSRNIPYEEVYSYDWLQELHNMSREQLPEGFLCRIRRVIKARDEDLVLLIQIHHTLFDGLSLCEIITELSDLINDQANNKPSKPSKKDNNLLKPPLENYAKEVNIFAPVTAWILSMVNMIPRTLLYPLLIQIMKVIPENKEENEVKEYFAPVPAENEETLHMVPFCLEKRTIQNLVKIARQHKATIFGVMSAAMRTVLEEDFEEKMGIPVTSLKSRPFDKTGASVGLRRYFNDKVPDNYMGLYVSIVNQRIASSGCVSKRDKFWDLARRYSEDLHQLIDNNAKKMMSVSCVIMESFGPREYIFHMFYYTLAWYRQRGFSHWVTRGRFLDRRQKFYRQKDDRTSPM